MNFKTMEWKKGSFFLLDQRKLPLHELYVNCSTYQEVGRAIQKMVVRGAPAIGVAAAFGMVLAAKQSMARSPSAFLQGIRKAGRTLIKARPTAVNLLWAGERMLQVAEKNLDRGLPQVRKSLREEARRILREDIQANREMGRLGQTLIQDGFTILTHCNAGGLATAGYGTALGVIRAAFQAGKRIHVFVDETRPFLQGSRLTAWELMKNRIPCTLITDNMAGALMAQGKIHVAIVGADRIAANGDVAKQIGTYSEARRWHAHRLPFHVAAPTSTIDLKSKEGAEIPIEQRPTVEITTFQGRPIAPQGVKALNPAFDVTPHRFIRAIITERGIVRKTYKRGLKALFSRGRKE